MGRPRKEENRIGHSSKYNYLTEHRSEIESDTIDTLQNAVHQIQPNGTINNEPHAQVQATGYFSKDNVKEYQTALVTHSFGKNAPKKKGRGTFFETVEEFDEWAAEFFMLCQRCEIIPTMSGLAAWLKVDRGTIIRHANNPNSIFYESAKQAVDICHNVLEAGASEKILSTPAYTFQAKNYYGLRDSQDVILSTSQQQTINNSDTLHALQEQRSTELKMGSIDMKEAKILEEND